MTTQASIDQFLSNRHLGLAGASRSGKKFGNTILKDLTSKGFEVSLVHPEADEIDGIECRSSVADLPEDVGGLVVVVPPDAAKRLVAEAARRGIENVWMQQGSESPGAVTFCRENDINVVDGECILMFAQPKGFHRLHRWLRGLFGKLRKAGD